ncbi:WD40 repeat domain-containing protein [Streptomyces ficellus]|uniref:WD40 repeat domain-containing protein n=1 Tax=Streptomyces ficellus TaxID=1977088 RepID=UPI00244DEEC2|nr:WD40 repeat domain-containing protein [Streptomyces ficellus]
MGDPDRGRTTDRPHDPTDDAAASFAARLRRLRLQRGLSLADMARQTHYSKGYLSKIETGAKRVTLDVARRCDEVLRAEGELLRLVREGPVPRPRPADDTDGDRDADTDTGVTCPYRGLSSFTPQDAGWFFGRERATAALVERVFERVGSGPLLLVAPSGGGKSSLLNAGLVPALRRPGGFPMPGAEGWPVVVCTPTAQPLQELLDCTAKALGSDLGISTGQVRERPERLLEAVRRLSEGRVPRGLVAGGDQPDGRAPDDRPSRGVATPAGDRRPPPVRPVLIVDQFEELFTLCPDEDERRAFVRVLTSVATSRPEATGYDAAVVVIGVRADFTGRCLDLPEPASLFTDGLFVLPPMSVAEFRESITRPARLAGVTLEPGLVQLLLRDVGLRDEAAAGGPDGRPGRAPSGALPLVSHALMATWQRREGGTLTVAGYEDTGGIQGAIARTAEDVFARLYPAEQRTIRRLLVRLVHVADGTGATRRRMSRTALLEQLADADGASDALDAFVRARLITMDSETVEITHEALLHAWPRLHGWIHADRAGLLVHQQLAHAAEDWEREGRDPSALYRGTRLDTVRSWADELDGASRLSPREEAFLRASRAEEARRAEQARRQVRLRQRMLATLVVLLLLALTAGGVAYQQRAGALDQERVARSQALAVRSTSLAAGQPEASMLLAEEAYRAEPTTEARGALLSTQSQPFSARLGGHGGPVNAVAFAPGGALLASASSDGTVRLWRVADRRTTMTFTVPGRVRAVAFSPDGRLLAATSTDGPVRLWDTAGGRAEPVAVLPAVTAGARALAFAPAGRVLAVATPGGTVGLFGLDGARPRSLLSLAGHEGRVNAVAFSPDGRTLLSAGSDRTVRLWDPASGRPPVVLRGHTDEVLGAAFGPDGRTVATGGVDRTVRVWDTRPPRSVRTLTGHDDDINAVAYTPDGTTVVSAGGDGTTRLWDVRGGRQVATLTGHTDYVQGVAVEPGGSVLATAGFDQSVVLWDLRGSVLTSRPFTEIWQAAYSPDGRLLATADADHTVRLWDVAGRRVVATFTGHRETVFAVAFAPDGRTLASAGSDGTVRLWDVAARRPLATLRGTHGDVFSVAFAPDGRTLASAGSDRAVRLWDVASRRPVAALTGHTDFANDVAFSPDGRTLASAGDDLTVRLWDVAGRRPQAKLTGHTGAVRGVAFAPDGRTLASSGNDGTVRLWDVRLRRSVGSLTGHTGSARGIAFSPDGRTLASSGNDRTVRVWDVPGRRLWAVLTGHTNAVWGIAFSRDGRTVASSSNDGTVRLWDLDVGARLAEICRMRQRVGPQEREELGRSLGVSLSMTCADR